VEVDCCGRFTHNNAMVGRPCFLHMQGFLLASGRTLLRLYQTWSQDRKVQFTWYLEKTWGIRKNES
jgi:hypothetical protein